MKRVVEELRGEIAEVNGFGVCRRGQSLEHGDAGVGAIRFEALRNLAYVYQEIRLEDYQLGLEYTSCAERLYQIELVACRDERQDMLLRLVGVYADIARLCLIGYTMDFVV